jgi:hypothetical protein
MLHMPQRPSMSLLTPNMSQSHAVTSTTTCTEFSHECASNSALLRTSKDSPVAARHTEVSIGDHEKRTDFLERNIMHEIEK